MKTKFETLECLLDAMNGQSTEEFDCQEIWCDFECSGPEPTQDGYTPIWAWTVEDVLVGSGDDIQVLSRETWEADVARRKR